MTADEPAADEPAADRITLRGLRVFGYHGVLDAERQDGQEFIVDAVLWLDTTAAAATDDLDLTANYAALATVPLLAIVIYLLAMRRTGALENV